MTQFSQEVWFTLFRFVSSEVVSAYFTAYLIAAGVIFLFFMWATFSPNQPVSYFVSTTIFNVVAAALWPISLFLLIFMLDNSDSLNRNRPHIGPVD